MLDPAEQTHKPFIEVAAGIITRPDGSLMLGQRPEGKPWAGWWELPGGKIEPGETTLQALARELKEELDIDVRDATPWVTYVHEYPKTIVRLAFCRVTAWDGEPRGMEGQALAWVRPDQPITVGPVLPATEPPLRWMQLPDHYLISNIGSSAQLTAWLDKLKHALDTGIRLVQFREPAWAAQANAEALAAYQEVLRLCRQAGALCLVNSCHPQDWWALADGVHLRAADALALAGTSNNDAAGPSAHSLAAEALRARIPGVIAVSAHTAEDLHAARRLQADFAVLGHVLPTPSHAGVAGMGWAGFRALAEDAGLPVFAIGGQSPQTLQQARQHGAHGIAGMRQLVG